MRERQNSLAFARGMKYVYEVKLLDSHCSLKSCSINFPNGGRGGGTEWKKKEGGGGRDDPANV